MSDNISLDYYIGTSMEMKSITSVSEYLLSYLRTEIITGGLAPGVKNKEYQLSETLNVSRPILREVLRTLEGEGLVVNVPRKGSYISNISLEDFNELYEIREMIESKAIDLLKVKNIRKIPQMDEIIEIESSMKIPPIDASPTEFLEFYETGLKFHSLLIETTGNKRMFQFYKGIQHNLLRYHVFQGSKDVESTVNIKHGQLAEMLEKGEFTMAKKNLLKHTKIHSDIIKKNLQNRSQVSS